MTAFDESLEGNMRSYYFYVDQLLNLAASRFKWKNLPESCDVDYLEMSEVLQGYCIFFEDEVMGYLTLTGALGGTMDVYRVPTRREIIAPNRYRAERGPHDSVVIYNKISRHSDINMIIRFAKRLYDLDQTVDVNARAQKTPVLLTGPRSQRLTLKNLYKQFDGNEPVIFGYKDLDKNQIGVLKTEAPYVAGNVQQLKATIWNEALTFLGITNTSVNKKERMLRDEATQMMGGALANRLSYLSTRRKACNQINKMFGLDISVEYNSDEMEEWMQLLNQEYGEAGVSNDE